MYVALLILLIVFVLIAVRQVGKVRLQLWQTMLLGAALMLITLQITLPQALRSINLDVLLFLFGVFVIGYALELSGALAAAAYAVFRRAKSVDFLVLLILFAAGLASALLMNDTLAIVGTPIVLLLALQHRVKPQVLLLALAFAVTIGSVMSPIGNPQNLLIALHGNLPNPFLTFLRYLLLPTIISLFLAYLVLRIAYSKEFHGRVLVHKEPQLKDRRLAMVATASVALFVLLLAAHIAAIVLHFSFPLSLPYIALISCLPVLLLSSKRFKVLKGIDWKTLVFFAALFIVMEAVWLSGLFQLLVQHYQAYLLSVIVILLAGVIISQFISNVPMVALFLPLLVAAGAGARELTALAAGSTIAGNMLVLGAASNIIIIQAAEERGHTLGWWEFAKVGIPLTILNIAVYWLFFVM